MKDYYKIVIVVLVYKNIDDLESFIKSLFDLNIECKVIIVNSFFDDETNNQFKLYAEKNSCDFIVVDNNGYGSGNNKGIDYAKANFEFDFLIVSNPDVEIINFNRQALDKYSSGIIGPITQNRSSNNKNPYWYLHSSSVEWLLYISAKRDIKSLFYLSVFLNKLIRIIFHIWFNINKKTSYEVYALQGTFLIFHKKSLFKIDKVFDDDMFLYGEEAHLAHLSHSKNIKMHLDKDITIYHKQGGSSSDISNKIWQFQKKSIVTYYKKWH